MFDFDHPIDKLLAVACLAVAGYCIFLSLVAKAPALPWWYGQ